MSNENEKKPDALLVAVREKLKTMTDEQRIDFIDECMENYCMECGKESLTTCYCHPAYDV